MNASRVLFSIDNVFGGAAMVHARENNGVPIVNAAVTMAYRTASAVHKNGDYAVQYILGSCMR